LWPLRDDDARAFFDEFYQALTRGNDVTGALRAAQAARIRAGAPAAAWAGVIAVGDGGVVPFPGGVPASPSSPATFWWLVAMLPALAAAWLAWRYRRRDHGR